MTDQPRRPRSRSRRTRILAAVGLLFGGTLGVGVLNATTASADAGAHTIVDFTTEASGPYLTSGRILIGSGIDITISCYVTGQSVTGPYGSENVWDLVSGGPAGVETGAFVPDAQIYTGSNSPVVPQCSTALGETIGSGPLNIRTGPGAGYALAGTLNTGVYVEVKCYSTGTTVNGPYGAENVWDRITLTDQAASEWIPDALVYTGSNSAVVPHC
jgi:uncharacterized protein YraI